MRRNWVNKNVSEVVKMIKLIYKDFRIMVMNIFKNYNNMNIMKREMESKEIIWIFRIENIFEMKNLLFVFNRRLDIIKLKTGEVEYYGKKLYKVK